MNRNLVIIPALLITCVSLPNGLARGGYFGPNPDDKPSVFTYGFRGLGIGSLIGISGGYLAMRDNGYEDGEWKTLLIGVGIGALAGSALGFGVGFWDLHRTNPGVGSIVLRDVLYGALFGAVVGVICGGISALGDGTAEHLLFGAALGTLIGSGAGLIFGLIEGPIIIRRYADNRTRYRQPVTRSWRMTLSAIPVSDRKVIPAMGLMGWF